MKIFLLVIVLFFLFLAFLMVKAFLGIVKRSVKKRQADFFVGKITDKKWFEHEDDESSMSDYHYYLYIATDEGKEVKYSVKKKDYDSFSVGDRVEKKVGEMLPRKV